MLTAIAAYMKAHKLDPKGNPLGNVGEALLTAAYRAVK